jgi:hypothetical protein
VSETETSTETAVVPYVNKSVTYDQSGTLRLPDAPDRSHMPVWANERTPTPARSSPLSSGLSAPHPALASEDAARRALLDHQYRNANGDTTSRITLVGVIEEGSRSLQSMDHWLCQSAAHLRAAGVSTPQLRRVRNAILALIPNWHEIGESIASQRRR